jgi:hypothetical protein
MDEYELARVRQILDANKDKGFVQRILYPEKYPTLDLGNGNYATHKMSYVQVGDKYHVFPTVLYDGKGALTQYDPRTAYAHARQTGNYIEFDNPNDAEWFSRRYKAVWGE